ncbi:Cof-type HAD-IIB family hydrolase [Bacillus mesophilum]|uniref:HAD family phosphatase n=1 Tax=Bacillus mesophilum TaxID=1071718 RepID=A0A7V7UTW1_9BACI|nr:Cof-type HAD-IIB family hydrolase [Bacillus mesophilum]KAB2330337.1 HAD family phosphatase [Bacillus mesophilum]
MKCISIDLDGTLLNSQHEITETSLKTLQDLKNQGHCVILNTGRAIADVLKVPGIASLELPTFCINGSTLYSSTGELLYEATIPVETYQEIFTVLKKLGVGILVYTNTGGHPSTLPPLHGKSVDELNTLFQEYDYDKLLEQEDVKIYKMIALVYNGQLEKIEEMKAALGPHFDVSMASSFPNNLEITSGEAHKGKALFRYQNLMNIEFEEIIAIGDGGNDLAQFEVATTSIAMGNAPLAIQNAADIVTKTNDDDGFSYAMEQLKLLSATDPIIV